MQQVIGALIPVFFLATIAVSIIMVARYRHHERMESLRLGITPLPSLPGKLSLAGGLLATFIGVALLILAVITSDNDTLSGGIVLIAIGSALLLYYRITTPERKRLLRLYEEGAGTGRTSEPPAPSSPE